MHPPLPSVRGWPFLVGAGRRRDYTTLLAPDFLVAPREHGVLDEVVSPIPADAPPRVIEAATRGGQRLGIAYGTHLVTAGDVANPRDEHSRPLRFIFGFVCPDGRITEPAGADLDAARTVALDVYRRFLDDEERFTAVPSAAFPLRSTVTALAVRDPGGSPRSAMSRPATWAWGAVIVAAAAAGLLLVATAGDEPAPRPTPPATLAPSAPTPTFP